MLTEACSQEQRQAHGNVRSRGASATYEAPVPVRRAAAPHLKQWKRPACMTGDSGTEPRGTHAESFDDMVCAPDKELVLRGAPSGAARRADPSRFPAGARWTRSRFDPAASCVGMSGVSS